MPRSLARKFLIVVFISAAAFFPGRIAAIEDPKNEMLDVGITTVLGRSIDLDLPFVEDSGKEIHLRDLFSTGRPVILLPVYYHCPRLCGLLMNGAARAFKDLGFQLGKDFTVVSVSFDSTETPEMAREKASHYRGLFSENAESEAGWRFLVGKEESVKPLMDQIGFHYKPDKGEFAHTSALLILTHQGEISQYFTGIEFPSTDLRLALVEASKGKIGSAFDHVLLFCFRFDSTKGRYTWAAIRTMKVGGVLTIIFLGGLILKLFLTERTRTARAK